jgi:hypothetical protein
MDKSKFEDILDEFDYVTLEVFDDGDKITAPWDVVIAQINSTESEKWQEYKAKFIAEGRM